MIDAENTEIINETFPGRVEKRGRKAHYNFKDLKPGQCLIVRIPEAINDELSSKEKHDAYLWNTKLRVEAALYAYRKKYAPDWKVAVIIETVVVKAYRIK